MAIPLYGQNKAGGKLNALVDNQYLYKFNEMPMTGCGQQYGGADVAILTGADDEEFVHFYVNNGLVLYGNYVGANTVDGPPENALGIEYSMTDTDNIGSQWQMSRIGALGDEGRNEFTIGGPAFYARLRMYLSVVAGTDDCQFGFKLKSDAVETTYVAYSDFASLNVDAGDIKYETNNDGGTATSADSGSDWGDAEIHDLEVRVSGVGLVSWYVDGNQITTNDPSYTFDNGDVVTPCFYFRNDSTTADCVLIELETGLQ
tara:strand:+ start:62 stop:838 length:777 start_codon:yes stop_codon:yes gene_type:complete